MRQTQIYVPCELSRAISRRGANRGHKSARAGIRADVTRRKGSDGGGKDLSRKQLEGAIGGRRVQIHVSLVSAACLCTVCV